MAPTTRGHNTDHRPLHTVPMNANGATAEPIVHAGPTLSQATRKLTSAQTTPTTFDA